MDGNSKSAEEMQLNYFYLTTDLFRKHSSEYGIERSILSGHFGNQFTTRQDSDQWIGSQFDIQCMNKQFLEIRIAFDSDWNIIDLFPSHLKEQTIGCSNIAHSQYIESGLLEVDHIDNESIGDGMLRSFGALKSSLLSSYLIGLFIAAMFLFGVVIWKVIIGDVNKERLDEVVHYVDSQQESQLSMGYTKNS